MPNTGIDLNQIAEEIDELQDRLNGLRDLLAGYDLYGMMELSESNNPLPGTKLHLHIEKSVGYVQ